MDYLDGDLEAEVRRQLEALGTPARLTPEPRAEARVPVPRHISAPPGTLPVHAGTSTRENPPPMDLPPRHPPVRRSWGPGSGGPAHNGPGPAKTLEDLLRDSDSDDYEDASSSRPQSSRRGAGGNFQAILDR